MVVAELSGCCICGRIERTRVAGGSWHRNGGRGAGCGSRVPSTQAVLPDL